MIKFISKLDNEKVSKNNKISCKLFKALVSDYLSTESRKPLRKIVGKR